MQNKSRGNQQADSRFFGRWILVASIWIGVALKQGLKTNRDCCMLILKYLLNLEQIADFSCVVDIYIIKGYNMANKLYVIGNGFDIHHDIYSTYGAFRRYCEREDQELYRRLENYYDDSDLLWSNFEMELANLNPHYLMDNARILHPEWNTSYKEMYAFVDGVKEEVDFLQISLKRCFCEWVEQLEKGNKDKRLDFDKENALFLSFNYTDTLEDLYKIPQKGKILYIHGKAESQFSQLVFGHHYSSKQIEDMMPDDDELEDEATSEIAEFLSALRKDSESIISQNEDFFRAIANVNNIYVLGHSLAEVDYPYFQKISDSVINNASWIISYFSDKDKENATNLMQRLNIPISNYKLIKLDQLGSEFMPTLGF